MSRPTERERLEAELAVEIRRHVDTRAQRMLAAAALLWVLSEVSFALLDRFLPSEPETVTHVEHWL